MRGDASPQLLYFDFTNITSIATAVLCAICMYLAYDITTITAGAPKAWYVIIAAFGVLLVKRTVQAYYDILTPGSDISADEAVTTLVVIIFFAVGLYMLDRTFRRQLKVSQEDMKQQQEDEEAYLVKNSSNHRFSRLRAVGTSSSSSACSVALKTISLKVQV
jgi:hypothetical protein